MNAIHQELTVTSGIKWRRLARIPSDRKDGRDVLLWRGHAIVCSWCDGWRDPVGREVLRATHFADIEGPNNG